MPDREAAKRIFMAALDLASAERPAFIAGQCKADAALQREVEALLAAHDGEPILDAATLPAQLANNASPKSKNIAGSARVGEEIGPYRLLERIGEGGFGEVWIAEQKTPVRRKVALKIIKAGMDTREVLARFEAERQALAMMDHPHIAHVLDAGATNSGRPYFVMELVTGNHITDYCDRINLTIPQRLELLIQVCSAVQHAHQKGVIHRDIKPSNVLVHMQDGQPHAKVIDFGIAKATDHRLTEKTLFTRSGVLVGTPAYMSPEQAEGSLDIDTRTDVYSLGVLMYELLTGTTPLDNNQLRAAAFAEMQRMIRETEPPKPSTRVSSSTESLSTIAARRRVEPKKLGTIVRGELDWIVMKALDKDRARRYRTADAFATDVQRHLAGEPVVAAPPSAAYRITKLVQRNRGLVIAASTIATSLLVATVVSAYFGVRAIREKQRAEVAEQHARSQAEIAQTVNDFLNVDLLATVAPSAMAGRGVDVKMHDVLEEAAKRIETASKPGGRFADQPMIEASIRDMLASTFIALGLGVRAEPHAVRAVDLRNSNQGPEHLETLSSMRKLGKAYIEQGKYTEAARVFEKLLEIQRRILGPEDPETLLSMSGLADSYGGLRKSSESHALFEQVLEAQRRVIGPEHADTLDSMRGLASSLDTLGRHEEARILDKQALEIRRRIFGPNDPGALFLMARIGSPFYRQEKYAEAQKFYEQMLQKCLRILGPTHPDTVYQMTNIASAYYMQGKYNQAFLLYEQALDVYERTVGLNHPMAEMLICGLGHDYYEVGRYDDALRCFKNAFEAYRSDPDPGRSTRYRINLVQIYLALDRPEDARPLLVERLQSLKKRADRPDAQPDTINGYAWELLTVKLADLQNPQEALKYAKRAAEASKNEDAGTLDTLAMAYYRTGDQAMAIQTSELAISLLPEGDSPTRAELEANLEKFRRGPVNLPTASQPSGEPGSANTSDESSIDSTAGDTHQKESPASMPENLVPAPSPTTQPTSK